MGLTITRRQHNWAGLVLLVLVCGGHLLCSALLYAQADIAGAVEKTTMQGTFIPFDAPGAVNGTFPFSINAAGNCRWDLL
jgi:hypothetical protein